MLLSQSIPRFAPATLHRSAKAAGRVAGGASSHTLSHSTRRPLSVVAMGKSGVPDAADSATEGVSLLSKKAPPKVFEHEKSKWLIDSDSIIPHVESSYPGKKLGDPKEVQQVGSKLLPSLVEFLKATGNDPASAGGSKLAHTLEALEAQIAEIEEGLQQSGGPYLGGKDVNAADLRVAPQLKHVIIGGKTIHNWTLPEKFTAVKAFLDEIEKRPSWKATYYKPEYVADGWKKKLEVMGAR